MSAIPKLCWRMHSLACSLAAAMLLGPGCVAHSPETGHWEKESNAAACSNLSASGVGLWRGRDKGESSMHAAAASHDPDCLKILLARGVNPDTADTKTGRTPIMTAIMAERRRHFDLLLQAGANVALADHMDNTPLHVAAQVNEPELVLALLKAGAPAGALNRQGRSFQTYLFMTPDRLLNARTRKARQDIVHWLTSHGIGVETSMQ